MADKKDGTKFSPLYQSKVAGGESVEVRLRLSKKPFSSNPLTKSFTTVFDERAAEADDFL